MAQIYDRTVNELLKEFIEIKKGGSFTKKEAVEWFNTNYPKVKKGTVEKHIDKFSTNVESRVNYEHMSGPPRNGKNDILTKTGDTYRVYDKKNDPSPIYLK